MYHNDPAWLSTITFFYPIVTTAVALVYMRDERLSRPKVLAYCLTVFSIFSVILIGLALGMHRPFGVAETEHLLALLSEGDGWVLYIAGAHAWTVLFWLMFVCRMFLNSFRRDKGAEK